MTAILDLYILSKLDEGLQTPYDLQRDAGLSLGAIVPALRRLSEQKLVTRVETLTSTKRPRHAYRLTNSGKKTIETGWKDHLKEGSIPTDLDALLRLVDVAQRYGAGESRLIEVLKSAANRRLALAAQSAAALETIHGGQFSYRVTRAKVETERLQAEGGALSWIVLKAAGQGGRGSRRRKGISQAPGQGTLMSLLQDGQKGL